MAVETLKYAGMKHFLKLRHRPVPLVVAAFIVLFVSSCIIPSNKETYISRFEKFVERIEKEHDNYNGKDWKWADSQFEKFSGEWYDEYRGEFTLKEKLKVQLLIVRYEAARGRDNTEKRMREYLKEDAEELKEKVEEYLRQDADEDLEQLKEGMKEIGDSAVKVFEDVVKSLKKKLDE